MKSKAVSNGGCEYERVTKKLHIRESERNAMKPNYALKTLFPPAEVLAYPIRGS